MFGAAYSRDDAQAYTRWLATHHYENFQVVSYLLPKALHQDFYNVYSYCRWADDLGDETGNRDERRLAIGKLEELPPAQFDSALAAMARARSGVSNT